MSEFVGAFGRVSEVKAVKSQGVSRITIEVPIEHHKLATSSFFDAEVILTLGRKEGSYGVFTTDSIEEEKQEDVGHGSYYVPLFKFGWFNNPQIWHLFGTDRDYQNFVRKQPSCVSKEFSEYMNGEGRCEFAHVRRAANAGTGIKPEYSGVPLTHKEHLLQHSKGESAFDKGKEFFDKKAAFYRSEWIKSVIYEECEVSSLSELDQVAFLAFAQVRGFYETLPKVMLDKGA